MRLDQLAEKIDAELVGDPAIEVTRLASLDEATAGAVSFLSNAKYASQLATTKASAVIVGPKQSVDRVALLKAKDPYFAFRQAVVALHGFRRHPFSGTHPQAVIDPSATVGENCIIYPGVYLGPRVVVGDDCILYPNVCIYDDCRVGNRVIVHSGAAIGGDGYGYAFHDGEHHKIPQVGNVVLEDDVEIGANCVIARGALGPTVIARGAKLDALVMIGHGVRVGEHSLLVAQVGIAGSTVLGHHVTMAGQVGIAGHLKIGDGVTVGAKSGVMNDIDPGQIVMGAPALPDKQAKRILLAQLQLPDILDRLRKLERQVEQMDASADSES